MYDQRPTHLDLFSGIGGFSLAFEAEGFRTVGFCEINDYSSAVLRKHWPHVPNYGDIKQLRGEQVGPVDVITGGFPCQPFSVAGKQRGKEDDRYLWPEMLRVINEVRPAFIVGENVTGFINLALDDCLSQLEGIGYTAIPFVVPACAVDAKHKRERVWIVAHSNIIRRSERGDKADSSQGNNRIEHSSNVADTSREQTRGLQQRTVQPAIGSGRNRRAEACLWPTEPAVGRVANGIPNRVHRLKCLGNAIVPAVARVFAHSLHPLLREKR